VPPWRVAGQLYFLLLISASDVDEKIEKAMDDIQDFVSKIYRQSLKQRYTDSYLKKQLPNVKF
jgi:hypothetical protein